MQLRRFPIEGPSPLRRGQRGTVSEYQSPIPGKVFCRKIYPRYSIRALLQRVSAWERGSAFLFATRSSKTMVAPLTWKAVPMDQPLPLHYLLCVRRSWTMPENEPPVILLVDDEEMILSAIKSFFAIDSDYALLTYTS